MPTLLCQEYLEADVSANAPEADERRLSIQRPFPGSSIPKQHWFQPLVIWPERDRMSKLFPQSSVVDRLLNLDEPYKIES